MVNRAKELRGCKCRNGFGNRKSEGQDGFLGKSGERCSLSPPKKIEEDEFFTEYSKISRNNQTSMKIGGHFDLIFF